jgi:hypothetical protein
VGGATFAASIITVLGAIITIGNFSFSAYCSFIYDRYTRANKLALGWLSGWSVCPEYDVLRIVCLCCYASVICLTRQINNNSISKSHNQYASLDSSPMATSSTSPYVSVAIAHPVAQTASSSRS